MTRTIGPSFASTFSLRACSLVYLALAVSALDSAEIGKHGASKTKTNVGFESIKNSKESAHSPHQHGTGEVIESGRNHSASGTAMMGDEGKSVALNRFLEDVLRARNDLKWTEHSTRHANRAARLDDPYTDQRSTVSVNTGDVLGLADVGYGSRLRGKRGFDRNYEAIWLLQKKKYGRESVGDVPQRVYLDNEMTYKGDAEGADFHAPYRSSGTLDRTVYEKGVMVDQPLKDWTERRDLHSPADWPNSNENLEVTNGEHLWLRGYMPTRKHLLNSDSNTEEGDLRHVGRRYQPEIVSLYNPAYVDDLIALRESPVAITSGKSQIKTSTLDSLKKTLLKLRNSLMLHNKKDVISRGRSNRSDDSRLTAEIFDSEERNLDSNLDKETIGRIKRAENTGGKDESNSRILYGAEFEGRDLEESYDRNTRSRRSSVADLNYTNNQQDILENKGSREAQTITSGNARETSKPEEIIVKSSSNNVNRCERNFANAPNETNIFKPRYFSAKEFFLHDHFINLTIIPLSTNNETNISGLKYLSSAGSHLNGHPVDNKSTLYINNDLYVHPPNRTTENQTLATSPISQLSVTDMPTRGVGRTTEDRANWHNPEENSLAWSTLANPILLSANAGIGEVSRRRSDDRSDTGKLGVAARKIPRLDVDDGQSRREEDAMSVFPRGNPCDFASVANESRCRVVETTTIVGGRRAPEVNGIRKESREPIPGVIMVFEARGRPYQKQGLEKPTTVRLSRLMGEDGTLTGRMRMSSDMDVGESRNANRQDYSSKPAAIDPLAISATAERPEAANAMTLKDRREDFTWAIVDNDPRGQQQMVPFLSGGNTAANKSNGNSDTDGIDIRVLGSNGNETMNVKEAARPAARPREHGRGSGNNLRRKLLWISTISGDTDTEDSMMESTRSIPDATTERRRIKNVINHDDRGTSKTVTALDFTKISSASRIGSKREDNTANNSVLQNALKSPDSDANHYIRHKRSAPNDPSENLARNNAAGPENAAIAKESAINHEEKQEDDGEYLNQNAEEVIGDYNDREEDVIKENDKAVEDEREGSSSSRKFDPIKARINMMIKQRLDKKSRNRDSDIYRRRKRDTLNMIEYYDYDEEQERDSPVNERKIKIKDDEFSYKNDAKVKRDNKMKSCKPRDLGKKKNENEEAVLKAEREKEQRKNKEPKEQIIVNLGERKIKTVRNDLDQKTKKPSGSSELSFENIFNERGQVSTKGNTGKLRRNNDAVNDIVEESGNVKSKWSGNSLGNGIALTKNSGSVSENNDGEKIISGGASARVDVNHDMIENILLDMEPNKILESNGVLEASEDLENQRKTITLKLTKEEIRRDYSLSFACLRSSRLSRSNGRPGDPYHYQESDRKASPNNVESLYEDLKNVYDWSDAELKSGPRLRGDQRLRYESDDKIDANPSQLQPLSYRSSSSQNNDAQTRYHSSDESRRSGHEQNNSAQENPSNAVSSATVQSGVSKIAEKGRNLSLEASVSQRSATDTDSGSPYENREYIESQTREMLKRNLDSARNQEAISSRDLHESFVEPLDWHDDFDDNVKVRFGRGLKAMNEIPDLNETREQVNGSDTANAISVELNPNLGDSPQTSRGNSSMSQDHDANAAASLMDIFHVRRDPTNDYGDLEAAEQRNVNRRTPRIRRTASALYHTLYDDLGQDQRDSNEADESLTSRSQLSNVFEDQSDGMHGGRARNWSNYGLRGVDRYSRTPQISRKQERSRKKGKKNKQTAEKRRKSGSRSSRERGHHARRSDVSRIASGGEWKKSKAKNKAHVSASTGRGSIQKSKTAERDLLRAAVVNEALGERVLYENAEDRSTVKAEEDEDARRKEITLLLAADNVDDESQMDAALHGELAGKIVEQIFERVQRNDQLKTVFGPGLQRDYKTKETVATANVYRQGLEQDGTNHTEAIMKRVMELLGRLILNEVQSKTCVSLSPDMREFLGWMLQVDREEESLGEAPTLPLVHEEIATEEDSGRKFLFDNTPGWEEKDNISDLQKKIRVLETLVEEYNALTAKDKTEVQAVYDYLIRQLNQLLQYIEAREAGETKGAARFGTGSILQYQNAMPNAINATYSTTKNASSSLLQMTARQLHDSHAASHHRKARSLDKVPSKQQRETKRQGSHGREKNRNHRKSMPKRRHQNRAGSSRRKRRKHRKSRRKRADREGNDRNSIHLGYEAPTIYDSFELLDAGLTQKKRKRKRELADKGSAAAESDRTLDSLPIKGKNRLEDEVILLNKREAWKKENEEQLEEVAFGRDMRNSTRLERKKLQELTVGDKRRPVDETSFRAKREDAIREASVTNNSRVASEIVNAKSGKDSTSEEDNVASDENRLRLIERTINVFADNNKTNAAMIDRAAAEVSTGGKLAINATADNQVTGKLRAINCETEIDKTNESTSFVNLMSDTEPRVSEERRAVPEVEREADDNAVKLNRAASHRSEEIDPEVELKNLRQQRERGIYAAADYETAGLLYNDNNFPGNKFRGKYVANLDELDDPDTARENNLLPLRAGGKKRPNNVVEWKLVPVIRRSPYRDAGASSRIYLREKKKVPASSNGRDIKIVPYPDSSKLRRLKYRGRGRSGAFNISPALRIIDDANSFSLGIPPKTKRAIGLAGLQDLRVDPRTLVERSRELSRPRNNKRSNGGRRGVVEFRVPFAWRDVNRKLRNLPRSRDHPGLGDRTIYDYGLDLRLPVWPYQYYVDFADSPTIFPIVPDIFAGADDTLYRYPTRAYLEHGPFKGRARHPNQRIARSNDFRLPGWKEAADSPADNSASNSSAAGPVREKFPAETESPVESARANRGDYLAPTDARKYTPGKIKGK